MTRWCAELCLFLVLFRGLNSLFLLSKIKFLGGLHLSPPPSHAPFPVRHKLSRPLTSLEIAFSLAQEREDLLVHTPQGGDSRPKSIRFSLGPAMTPLKTTSKHPPLKSNPPGDANKDSIFHTSASFELAPLEKKPPFLVILPRFALDLQSCGPSPFTTLIYTYFLTTDPLFFWDRCFLLANCISEGP